MSEATWFERVAVRRIPDFTIGDKENPSTLRWHLLRRNSFFNIYLHKWLRSDYDLVLHDHPYPNVSYLLKGTYKEQTVGGVKEYVEGSVKFRRATTAHRILIDQPCWSLFITGPRIREWGFYCPKGWKQWQEFIKLRDKGDPGKGCGEH